MKNKKIIILIGVILLIGIIITISIVFNKQKNKITDLEQIKINEINDDIIDYIEYIEENSDIDKYILFSLKYSSDKNDKYSLTLKEMKEIIENKFNKSFTEEILEKNGISPLLMENDIGYDYDSQTYFIYKIKKSYAEIANTKIIKYIQKDIVKKNNQFIVTYNKYVIDNPYDILNYYSSNEPETDTIEISKYLKGEEKIGTIKKYLNENNVSKIGKKQKDITITYIIKDNKILIDKVK